MWYVDALLIQEGRGMVELQLESNPRWRRLVHDLCIMWASYYKMTNTTGATCRLKWKCIVTFYQFLL